MGHGMLFQVRGANNLKLFLKKYRPPKILGSRSSADWRSKIGDKKILGQDFLLFLEMIQK